MRHRIIRTNGQRIAWTNTSSIPDDEVVEAIKFVAREVNLDRVVVHMKKRTSSRYYGWAYRSIPRITNLEGLKRYEWRYLITVQDLHYTHFVSGLAHEAKHIEQYREKLPASEVRCRAFQQWLLARWLEKQTAPA